MNILKYVIWPHDLGKNDFARYMLRVNINLVCIEGK